MGLTAAEAAFLLARIVADAIAPRRAASDDPCTTADVQTRPPMDAAQKAAFTAMLREAATPQVASATCEVATRSRAGRTARAHGTDAEEALDAMHARYSIEGRAHLTRVPTPALVLGKVRKDARGRTTFPGAWAARTGADYVGWCRVGDVPRPVALELKTCTVDRVAIDRVKPTQAAQLTAYDRPGALALVLVGLPAGWWLISWSRWGVDGRKSLAPAHLDAAGVRVALAPTGLARGPVAPDWLAAVGV